VAQKIRMEVEKPVWVICDTDPRFIMLGIAAENQGICPKRPEKNDDASGLAGFVAMQLLGCNRPELGEIVKKISKEYRTEVEPERVMSCKWDFWVQKSPI